MFFDIDYALSCQMRAKPGLQVGSSCWVVVDALSALLQFFNPLSDLLLCNSTKKKYTPKHFELTNFSIY